jgi:predicted small integral membrane protein
MGWMAWTKPTAILFGVIFAAIIAMGIWEAHSPAVLRRGFLPMATTRGDRLFIGILAAAFINMAWLALTTITPLVSLGIALVVMIVIGLWG